jgi:AraC-like DNA-binding protein
MHLVVEDIIKLIVTCKYEDKARYDAHILFQVLRLLDEFNTEMARYLEAEKKKEKEQQNQKASEKRLEQLFPYIDSHLGEKLEMKTLCELFEVSSSTLKRYIDEQLRTTLSDYVLEARMQKGRQLLREGKMMIGKIADSLSYAQCSSFARAYRKRFNCSPTEERLLYTGIKE